MFPTLSSRHRFEKSDTYLEIILFQNVTLDWKPDGVGNIHFLARYRGYESRFLHPLIN